MADENSFAKRAGSKQYPNVTLSSFSSAEGNDKYFLIDIWGNKASITFTDISNRDNPINLKFNLILDRAQVIFQFLKGMLMRRREQFLAGESYDFIPEESAFKVNLAKANAKIIPGAEPHILIYTKEIDGIPRVTLKGVDNGKEIEIPLCAKYAEINVSNPMDLYRFDILDASFARLVQCLDYLVPSTIWYKLFDSFFTFFLGTVRRDKQGNRTVEGGNMNSFSSGTQKNLQMNNASSDEVPF